MRGEGEKEVVGGDSAVEKRRIKNRKRILRRKRQRERERVMHKHTTEHLHYNGDRLCRICKVNWYKFSLFFQMKILRSRKPFEKKPDTSTNQYLITDYYLWMNPGWSALRSLPESVLFAIVKLLNLPDMVNFLRADRRFLMLHGLPHLWRHHMTISRPYCLFLSQHLKDIQDFDFFLSYRKQGKLSFGRARKVRDKYLRDQRKGQHAIGLIIYRPATSCYCLR